MPSLIDVEVAYATPAEQTCVALQLEAGAIVGDALAAVADREPFASLDLAAVPVGVYGVVCERSRVLEHEDRVEIYRPLEVDPKDARRRRAGQAG